MILNIHLQWNTCNKGIDNALNARNGSTTDIERWSQKHVGSYKSQQNSYDFTTVTSIPVLQGDSQGNDKTKPSDSDTGIVNNSDKNERDNAPATSTISTNASEVSDIDPELRYKYENMSQNILTSFLTDIIGKAGFSLYALIYML